MGVSTVAQENAEFIPWQEERVGCCEDIRLSSRIKKATTLGIWDGRKLLMQAHFVEAGLSMF